MSTIAQTQSQPRQPTTLSRLLSRVRSKPREEEEHNNGYIDPRPPLNLVPLPLVLPEHQQAMVNLGWTTVTFPSTSTSTPNAPHPSDSQTSPPLPTTHPLQSAYQDLFTAAQSFFDLPMSEKQKHAHHTLGSEEGYTSIPGEKEFLTLRTLDNTPPQLRDPAERYWALMAVYLGTCLGRMSTAVGLPDNEDAGFRGYIGACKTMTEVRTSSMLRIFRYEGSGDGKGNDKVVAEPHADLGLLSCVVGDVPGLEVWDGSGWFRVEMLYGKGGEGAGMGSATVMAGRQIQALSNGRFRAGGHRVVSYSPKTLSQTATSSSQSSRKPQSPPQSRHSSASPKYRHSIVFVLRADVSNGATINTDLLTTPITGDFEGENRRVGVLVRDWYREIHGRCFNVNTGIEEREGQKRRLEQGRGGKGDGGSGREVGMG